MKKKITIHRTSDKKGAKRYTPITNEIMQNKRMTIDEVGLLCFLLSLPKEFKILKVSIQSMLSKRITDGRFRKAWDALKAKGHLEKINDPSKNLKRVHWIVYETPQHRDTQNRDSREKPLIKSTLKESKQVESNNIENTNIINNTGPSILEKKVEYKSQFQITNEIHDEAAAFLYDATSIGEEIFNYSNPVQYPVLKSIIGEEEFNKVEQQLKKYNRAATQLGLR